MDKDRTALQQLARLITPRKIIALSLTMAAVYLWLVGKVDLYDIYLVVIGWYFGTATALDKPGE